eukprot:GHVH01004197.1.p1 GENE.GHVH01004197.1~~GHVH01004197.1.p1  ORF type:complete len:732 (+),score=68.04 GHVH01004197.1:206-2401(+)
MSGDSSNMLPPGGEAYNGSEFHGARLATCSSDEKSALNDVASALNDVGLALSDAGLALSDAGLALSDAGSGTNSSDTKPANDSSDTTPATNLSDIRPAPGQTGSATCSSGPYNIRLEKLHSNKPPVIVNVGGHKVTIGPNILQKIGILRDVFILKTGLCGNKVDINEEKLDMKDMKEEKVETLKARKTANHSHRLPLAFDVASDCIYIESCPDDFRLLLHFLRRGEVSLEFIERHMSYSEFLTLFKLYQIQIDVKRCFHCLAVYDESVNCLDPCLRHLGRPVTSKKCPPFWSCCKSPCLNVDSTGQHRASQGCMSGKHESDDAHRTLSLINGHVPYMLNDELVDGEGDDQGSSQFQNDELVDGEGDDQGSSQFQIKFSQTPSAERTQKCSPPEFPYELKPTVQTRELPKVDSFGQLRLSIEHNEADIEGLPEYDRFSTDALLMRPGSYDRPTDCGSCIKRNSCSSPVTHSPYKDLSCPLDYMATNLPDDSTLEDGSSINKWTDVDRSNPVQVDHLIQRWNSNESLLRIRNDLIVNEEREGHTDTGPPQSSISATSDGLTSDVERKSTYKTKFCPLHRFGSCPHTAANCRFAHSLTERRFTQDLYKTQLCIFWKKGSCRAGSRCHHAHGSGDLRIPLKAAHLESSSTFPRPPRDSDSNRYIKSSGGNGSVRTNFIPNGDRRVAYPVAVRSLDDDTKDKFDPQVAATDQSNVIKDPADEYSDSVLKSFSESPI